MPRIVSEIVDVYVFRRLDASHVPERNAASPHADRGGSSVEFLQLLRAPQRAVGETWQSVHGKIEAGETALHAALRELREETGLTPTRLWQLETVNSFFIARDDAIHLCPGFVAEVAHASTIVLSDEHVSQRWLSAATAADAFLWPGQRSAIREIREVILAAGLAEPLLRLAPLGDPGA